MSATILKFMAVTGYNPRVVVVFCEKETASCVWIKGRRAAKNTDYESYFDTFTDAMQHLIDYQENKVEKAVSTLEFERMRLAKTMAIEAPKATP